MEEKIKKELKKVNKMIDSLTKKQEREVREKEREEIQKELYILDGRFEAYMKVLKMLKEV